MQKTRVPISKLEPYCCFYVWYMWNIKSPIQESGILAKDKLHISFWKKKISRLLYHLLRHTPEAINIHSDTNLLSIILLKENEKTVNEEHVQKYEKQGKWIRKPVLYLIQWDQFHLLKLLQHFFFNTGMQHMETMSKLNIVCHASKEEGKISIKEQKL